MLSVHGGTDVFQTSLSSGKQEPADNTDHVTSTGKKNVLKGNDLNVREALATTSSFAQLNKISTFLGDVKTDEEPKGEEDEGTIQESRLIPCLFMLLPFPLSCSSVHVFCFLTIWLNLCWPM